MLKSTLSVSFQGLGEDVDEKARRGQERRKERKLQRQRRRMAQDEIFRDSRAFLEWIVQRFVDDVNDGDGIFRNLPENVAAAAAAFNAMREMPEGQNVFARAREEGYCHSDDSDKNIVKKLLENDCNSWKNDQAFVLNVAGWAGRARADGHYLSYSYSSSEGGDRVEVDAFRVTLVRNLGQYSDTFLASTNVLTEVCRLVVAEDFDAATTALSKDLLGDNFDTGGPQDPDGIDDLQAAVAEAIHKRSPTENHRDHLESAAKWLVDASVTPEERGLVLKAVFGPAATDHVSRASTSVEEAPASSV